MRLINNPDSAPPPEIYAVSSAIVTVARVSGQPGRVGDPELYGHRMSDSGSNPPVVRRSPAGLTLPLGLSANRHPHQHPAIAECPDEELGEDASDGIEIQVSTSTNTEEEERNDSEDAQDEADRNERLYIKIDYDEKDGITRFKNVALYLHEGEYNDKFFHHPQTWWSYLAFQMVHNEVYQYTQLAVSLLLMGLAIIEPPTFIRGIPPWVHSSLEMVFLLFFVADTVFQLIWLQPRAFITRKRTVLKVIIITLEYIEAIVVVAQGDVHIRVLRCLRPYFFVDCFITSGVRRVLRQILQSLGSIIDIVLLYILAVALFSLIAFYLFGSYDDIYFKNFRETFVSMFVAQTSANFPDVMMEAYYKFPFAPVFFVFYIMVQFYIVSNMLLALVYSTFQGESIKKFKKLYIHKKEALKLVFDKLQRNNVLHFADFYLLMKAYLPNASKVRVLCMFKALDKDGNNFISLKEFYNFYNVLNLTWGRIDKKEGKSIVWHEKLPKPFSSILRVMRMIVEWPFFDFFVNFYIVVNGILLWVYTASIELTEAVPDVHHAQQRQMNLFYISLSFTVVYSVELLAKIVALGPAQFFMKAWNMFDFILVMSSIIGHLTEETIASIFVFLRPLRLLRLLRLKRRYRDMMNTLIILLPHLLNIVLVLFVLFYFYAILGMEFLSDTVHPGCCGRDGEAYPVDGYYSTGNNTLHFYLNNFDSIASSLVTLFELMYVNNWHIIMEGFRLASHGDFAVRTYFISFSLCTEVILTIIIAYIIDTFVTQYRLSEKLRKELKKNWDTKAQLSYFCKPHRSVDELDCRVLEVEILQKHIDGLESINAITVVDRIAYQLYKKPHEESCDDCEGVLKFRGRKRRNKEDINEVLYQDNIQDWDKEFDEEADLDEPGHKTFKEKMIKELKDILDYWLL